MPLYTYTIEQTEEWNRVVRSFDAYDVYYLAEYAKAFQIHGDGYPLLFYYEDENIKGINVVMKRDIADMPYFSDKIKENTTFDFTTPYGYGGWILSGNGSSDALFVEYEKWCKSNNVVSEFVRYHPVVNNVGFSNSFYDVTMLGDTVFMDLTSADTIWANLTSKNRNMIRKAQKLGVKIYNGHFPEIYKKFKEIYDFTMDFDNASEYYYFSDAFYDGICNGLNEESQVFWAELDGKIIASAIMLLANGRMNYHLSGFLREYQSFAPTNLLLYKAALWGCRNGYKTFHLGGGVGSQKDSLYKFKSAFNRYETKCFGIGKKIYLPDKYKELTVMKNSDTSKTYFPIYRA